MKNIGRYNGIPCIECSYAEYRNIRRNKLDKKEFIYVVGNIGNINNNRPMVRDNKIVGYYDGHTVRDVYQNEDYIKDEKPAKVSYEEEVKQASLPQGGHNRQVPSTTGCDEVELKIPEINFSDYSQIVDNFFKNLK